MQSPDYNNIDTTTVGKFRKWFREAVDGAEDWQKAAQEDYDFVCGKQWTDDELQALEKSRRPAVTINRIKPLLNVLSGYQRLNRYDIDFLPRTSDDAKICEVRKGMTKYVLDRCEYETHESRAFLDAAIGGLGWMEIGYKFDDDLGDGEAFVKREDPFGIYPDPEAHRQDYSDAKYVCRAKWVDKDELILAYPDHRDAIEAQYALYDEAERQTGNKADELWYKRDLQKARMVECWYKQRKAQTMYFTADGQGIPEEEMTMDIIYSGAVESWRQSNVTEIRCAVFVDTVLLEDIPSPYQHGEFPFVPVVCYAYGAGDLPAGIVRDLKDPQREINKRRVQELHILDNTGSGGGWIEDDAMTEDQWHEFENEGSTPGHYQKVRPQALAGGKIREKSISEPSSALIQAQAQAQDDLVAISGINEALMGTDIPSQSSGRAIELKQKQAITHIAPMFDELRKAKKRIAYLLWGKRGKAGVIPQFYTEDKVYRIEGANGQQFIRVNQQVIQQDPMGNAVVSTLNDLSQGEFDVVVSDVQASTTQRQAQMWSLVDAVGKLQVPGDLVFDIIIDLSDLPNKDEIKERWAQRQQQQAMQQQQAAQAQMELERIKNENINQTISFRDAPLPIQLAMAAKQGLIDPQIAEYAVNLMTQNMFPQLAEALTAQRQQQAQMQQMQQQAQMQQQMQGQPPPMMSMQQQQPQQQPQAMTQAAAESVMNAQVPAM